MLTLHMCFVTTVILHCCPKLTLVNHSVDVVYIHMHSSLLDYLFNRKMLKKVEQFLSGKNIQVITDVAGDWLRMRVLETLAAAALCSCCLGVLNWLTAISANGGTN